MKKNASVSLMLPKNIAPPPAPLTAALAQAVEDVNVEDLAEHVGHKAGDGDARHEQVKTAQRRESLPLS